MDADDNRVFCSCFRCLASNFGRPKLVDRSTRYRHVVSAAGGEVDADAHAAGGTLNAADGQDGVGDVNMDGEEDEDISDNSDGSGSDKSDDSDTSDASYVYDAPEDDNRDALEKLKDLLALGANGVRLSLAHFRWSIDDVAGAVWAAHHKLTRSAVAEFLKLRGGWRRLRTPARVASFLQSSVHLAAIPISCCPNGCMAFYNSDDGVDQCLHCDARRFKQASVPAPVMPYWPLTPWLRMMLADPKLSAAMQDYMAYARGCAAEVDVTSFRDWFDGATFRRLVKDGFIVSDFNIVLGVALDGFDSWRQTGCKGWPVVVTILSLPPEMRTKIVCMLPVLVTPGPGEPVDLDSFLAPLMAELNALAAGVPGMYIDGKEGTHTLRAFCVQVTTDLPAGQKVTHMTGHAGFTPNRFRTFHGALASNNAYYFPPIDPRTGAVLFSVLSPASDSRGGGQGTVAGMGDGSADDEEEEAVDGGIQADADAVEAMRTAGRPASHINALSRLTGVNGWSPLLTPGPHTRASFPSLSYLWAMGPAGVAPYDTMHLFFCNVVPKLWALATGKFQAEKNVVDAYVLSKSDREMMGGEYKAAARTVPARQARAMRDIDKKAGSFKAADWLFFLLCGGEALLYGRVPEDFYSMFMCLCRAGRILFTPSPVSPAELETAETEIANFLTAYYSIVYRGKFERLKVCLFVFAALLDVVPNVRQCGPAWVFWQFPLERFIGTLPSLVGSRSQPHSSLVNAIAKRHRAELLEAYALRMCPGDWEAATGQTVGDEGGTDADDGGDGRWRRSLPDGEVTEVTLLHPVKPIMELAGAELVALRQYKEELARDDMTTFKCYRAALRDGTVITAGDGDVDETANRRRTSLLRVQSSDRRQLRNGTEETFLRRTYGVVEHFLLCEGSGGVTALAYVRLVRSRSDRTGRYGIPDEVRGMHAFSDYEGTWRYVDVMSILDSVGCITRGGRHYVLYTREPFSNSVDAE